MLGCRGGTHPQDRAPHHGDHGRDPHPDRRLRRPGRGGPGPRGPAAARPGALPVLVRGPADRHPGPGRPARRAGRPGGGPRPACGRRTERRGRDVTRRYAGFSLTRGVARIIWRLLRVTGFVAGMILAAPAVLVAAYSATLAWSLGGPPRQLYRAAAWCLPMLAAWLAALAASGQSWSRLAAAPYLTWLAAWREAAAGGYLKAAVTV